MNYDEVFSAFPKQFEWDPVIENADRLKEYEHYIICGVGTSALGGDILRTSGLEASVVVWRDYGLPSTVGPNTMIIVCSYSGQTEESIDNFNEAMQRHLPVAVVTSGGPLLIVAQQKGVPIITLPYVDEHAVIYSGPALIAFMKLMGSKQWAALKEVIALSTQINVAQAKSEGDILGVQLKDRIPIVCASAKNFPIAFNWKTKFNEIAKIPAFAVQFPDSFHSELTGFDAAPKSKTLSEKLDFVFLVDEDDDPRVLKRMHVVKDMYLEREFRAHEVPLFGNSRWLKVYYSFLVGNWTALFLAKYYHTEEAFEMKTEFTKRAQAKHDAKEQ